MTDSGPFTGHVRRRKTTRAVKVAEVVSRSLITVGGFGTILAVGTICVFLVWVVLPIFGTARIEPVPGPDAATGADPATAASVGALAAGMDEQMLAGWSLLDDGRIVSRRLDDGSLLEERRPFGDEPPTAITVDPLTGAVAAGYEDGAVQWGRIAIEVEFLTGDEPGELAGLAEGAVTAWRGGLVTRTSQGQLRDHRLGVRLGERLGAPDAAVRRVALLDQGERRVLAVLRADGRLALERVRERPNMLTGAITTTVREQQLPYEGRAGHGPPTHMLLGDRAADVYLAWPDGFAMRFDAQQDPPALAETVKLTAGSSARLTALGLLIGRSTLIVGDSEGTLRGWFLARPTPDDEPRLVMGHVIPGDGAPVTCLAPSTRTRSFAAGDEGGRVRVAHMSSDRVMLDAALETGPARVVSLAPRDDGLLALGDGAVGLWRLGMPHPETTLATLFLPVWYEGEARPQHVWQSSGGTDGFEPKLGLFPLVFGTIKATFYSMIFSVPVALLAAVYTSEFLARRARARVKQAIEMMATLPSVVLGFMAAIVMAPFIEGHLPAVLAALLTVPACWLAGAHLWQLLPQPLAVRWGSGPRMAAIAGALAAGLGLAAVSGPTIERMLFAGDLHGWLAGRAGSAFAGWFFVLLPLAGVAAAWIGGRWITPWLRETTAGWSRRAVALIDLAKLAVLFAVAVAISTVLSWALQAAGLDARGGLAVGQVELAPMGTYIQLNALIVGFVMGFAVIPIIYTLAEDALSSVPDHLRAASLATGATPWQTAYRVVVPTAMSGLFSAVMIGLGRAVGETMVVLMAAGNTPLMEANMFNGFRTLSANIATELPEAVQGGSLYRVLFLAALTLFAMTFVINTFAEVVRQRFRKRAYQL